jgi:hypothetical protein
MIFYKAIKYKILDICVDLFFGRLLKNIAVTPTRVGIEDLHPDMCLSKIVYGDMEFIECKIISVYKVRKNQYTVRFHHKEDNIFNRVRNELFHTASFMANDSLAEFYL